jgi:hypothetical protein
MKIGRKVTKPSLQTFRHQGRVRCQAQIWKWHPCWYFRESKSADFFQNSGLCLAPNAPYDICKNSLINLPIFISRKNLQIFPKNSTDFLENFCNLQKLPIGKKKLEFASRMLSCMLPMTKMLTIMRYVKE